jgi:hypothetical protein
LKCLGCGKEFLTDICHRFCSTCKKRNGRKGDTSKYETRSHSELDFNPNSPLKSLYERVIDYTNGLYTSTTSTPPSGNTLFQIPSRRNRTTNPTQIKYVL